MNFWRGNTTGVEMSNGNYDPLEAGEYKMRIIEVEEMQTKNGDPMAKIKLFEPLEGKLVWDYIVFPLPGSSAYKILGRSLHFLHCIGEPYESDDLIVDPQNWREKSVDVEIDVSTYKDKDGNERKKNVVKQYKLESWDEEDSPNL